MQTYRYNIGIWQVEARLEGAGDASRIAAVMATAGQGDDAISSTHTVVFDHTHGSNEEEETRAVLQRVLLNAH